MNSDSTLNEPQTLSAKTAAMAPEPESCPGPASEQPGGRSAALVLSFKEAPGPNSDQRRRINLDPDHVQNGLAQLVLSLVKLLHELLERQALRRIESGQLSQAACERLGFTLMKQSEQLDALRESFGLTEEDLNLDLGPLGKLI